MIPDWITYTKDAVEVVSVVVGIGASVWRMGYRLGQQDKQLEWQSRALEAMSKKAGSDPPPRPKLTTLTDLPDPFDGLVDQARALRQRKE